jgi:L-fucose mutarotase
VVESAAVMAGASSEPEIWNEFRDLLKAKTDQAVKLEAIERSKFYDAAGSSNVALTIATGEQRIFANLLLTIGVVQAPN